MSAVLAEFAALTRRLTAALSELERLAAPLKLAPLATREWYELLERKLAPQLGDQAFLIVAVTGGTNIGKSVVFNHLAGFRASASSPLASGTKHPVCLAPEGFAEIHDLAALFPGFVLHPWTAAQEALEDSSEHRLYWRESAELPANLLVLDTPDIDSDAPVNWQRADAIRHCADVLIAVLTQQKYNDAAVKQFFRKAAAEQKAVVVVFNQCELPDDENYWPLWLKTFATETGVEPEYVYIAPSDRAAAEELRLPFGERGSGFGVRDSGFAGSEPEINMQNLFHPKPETRSPKPATPTSLQDVFSRFHFAHIKLQTLRGSLALVADERDGLPSYLREVSIRSSEFRTAAELLSTQKLAEIDDWPAPPNDVMIGEVRNWWAAHRDGWSARVHGIYDTIGQTLFTPVSYVRNLIQGPVTPPWDLYRQKEWDAIVRTVAKVYGKLEWLSELGNALLKARLDQLLRGTSRAELLSRLQSDHQLLDFSGELGETVKHELQSFRHENPQLFHLLKRLDEAAAAARPALSVALFVSGVGLPLGIVGDVAVGAAAVTVGETAISRTTSSGVGYVQAKFHRLQAAFTAQRAKWLAERLDAALLGALAMDLQSAAGVSRSAAYQCVAEVLREWNMRLRALEAQG